MLAQLSDIELMASLKEGNHDAYQLLYERW